MAIGMYSQNPKKDSMVQMKFAKQINHYWNNDDYWQLEQLCEQKADSICDPLLTWGRGMAAAKFMQFDEAKKQLGLYIYEYRDRMPEDWMVFAVEELTNCFWWQGEYDEIVKVTEVALQYFSEEGDSDKFQRLLERFQWKHDASLEFAKYPKMMISRDDSDISIPFRIKTLGKKKSKSSFMSIDGSIQGRSVSMVFDTGCSQNVISKKMADELNLKPIDVNVIVDSSVSEKTTYVMADSLQIGNVVFLNVKFVLNNNENDTITDVSSLIVGLPIMQLMRQFTMDFKRKVITSPFHLDNYTNKNLSLNTSGGGIYVRIHHNDAPINMMIDTGNGHFTHLDYKYYTQHKDEVDRCKVSSATYMGLGGIYEMEYALMKNFKFMLNKKQYSFPIVTVPKNKLDAALGDNNIGLPFMSGFKQVTISLKDAHVEFVSF